MARKRDVLVYRDPSWGSLAEAVTRRKQDRRRARMRMMILSLEKIRRPVPGVFRRLPRRAFRSQSEEPWSVLFQPERVQRTPSYFCLLAEDPHTISSLVWLVAF